MAQETLPISTFIIYTKKNSSPTDIHKTYSWYVHPKDYQSYDDFFHVRAVDYEEAEKIARKMCDDKKVKFVQCKRIGGKIINN